MTGKLTRLLIPGFLICQMYICTFAQVLYSVKLLDFNTREFDEFAPVIYDRGIVFNTFRKQNLYKSEVDLNESFINDLYFTQKSGNGTWSVPHYFSNELNSKNHEGKATFSRDGSTIYFTRFEDGKAGHIYKASKSGGKWHNLDLTSFNSEEYRIKDPSLSIDGKNLYFASMAPGGYGGYDIYVSSFERGDWRTPKNLGPLVNTEGDEVAPFIHANGKLYFSSKKLQGARGYDVFYTREINAMWIKPVQLPAPINSDYDDLYYISDEDDSSGYFSSNRNHSFDIFAFNSLWPQFKDCKPLQKNEYTYIFTENETVDNDTTSWLYEWDFGDGTKVRGRTAEAKHTFAKTGQYMIQLNVIDTLTGDILLNESAYPLYVTDIEQAFISCSDTVDLGIPVKFDASSTNLPEFKKIEGYYWDFGDGDLSTGVAPEHIYYLPGKYVVKLCVQSMQDNTGAVKKSCVYKEIFIKPKP